MSAASDLHNLLSGRFIRDVVGPAVKNGATDSELMVLFESCQAGMMHVLARHYGIKPGVVVGLMEASFQRAIERFSQQAPTPSTQEDGG